MDPEGNNRDKIATNRSEFKVTPWEVEGDIDYGKLIVKFGTQPITSELLPRRSRA